MKKTLTLLAGVITSIYSAPSQAAVDRARIIMEGNAHTGYVNSEGTPFLVFGRDVPPNVYPGTMVSSKYVEINYITGDKAGQTELYANGVVVRIMVGECVPGEGYCRTQNGTIPPFKICSEWSFMCTEPTGTFCELNTSTDTMKCCKGFYQDEMNCARCSLLGDEYATTKSDGATSVTECYIPSGISFSDSTGTWEYSSDCYYGE